MFHCLQMARLVGGGKKKKKTKKKTKEKEEKEVYNIERTSDAH